MTTATLTEKPSMLSSVQVKSLVGSKNYRVCFTFKSSMQKIHTYRREPLYPNKLVKIPKFSQVSINIPKTVRSVAYLILEIVSYLSERYRISDFKNPCIPYTQKPSQTLPGDEIKHSVEFKHQWPGSWV